MLYSGTVVPATVEKNDFSFSWEVGHIALKIPLSLFTFCGYAQCDHTTDSWVQALVNSFDYTALSGGIPALKNDNNA